MSIPDSNMRNPLAHARGRGSAKQGVHHWIAQRVSAILLVLLFAWFVYALACLAGADYATVRAFVARPLNAALALLLLLSLLYHAMLGMQVVIEDYVHHRATELALHFLTRAAAWLGMALAVVSILKIALGA